MKVKLAKDYGADLLTEKVNKYLAEGWHLTGNPFCGIDGALYWPIALLSYEEAFPTAHIVNDEAVFIKPEGCDKEFCPDDSGWVSP